MFYDREEIVAVLKCPECRHMFTEPWVLPCGQTMCRPCVEKELDRAANGLTCKLCAEFHSMPQEGFPPNKRLALLLDKQPREVYRNKEVETLKTLLASITVASDTLADTMRTPSDKVRERCDSLRNELQASTHSAVEQLNKHQAKFMSEIESYERECLERLDVRLKKIKQADGKAHTDADQLVVEKRNYLQKFVIDEGQVSAGLKQAERMKQRLDQLYAEASGEIFKNAHLEFNAHAKPLDAQLLGEMHKKCIKAQTNVSDASPPSSSGAKSSPSSSSNINNSSSNLTVSANIPIKPLTNPTTALHVYGQLTPPPISSLPLHSVHALDTLRLSTRKCISCIFFSLT